MEVLRNCKMKVLLIGGTGVISTDIMNLTVEKGYDVFVLNRGNRKELINNKATLIKADINDLLVVNRKISDLYFDVVVDFLSYNKEQLENSLNIFRNKCRQYIFISSVAVYDRTNINYEINEDNCPLSNPNWDYSINKVECENYLISRCNEFKINYTIVRPSITYGNSRIPYGIMPNYGFHWTLISRIQNNKPIVIWDEGITVCTLTHSFDFAKGFVDLLNNPKAFNEAFHIVGDQRSTWSGVLKIVSEVIGKECITVNIPSEYIYENRPLLKGIMTGDRSVNAKYDNSKLKSVAPNFKCDIDLKTGISNTINYYQENNYLLGIDYKWDADMDRLISCYLKKTDPLKLKNSNLNFINCHKATPKDKLYYYIYRYSFFYKAFNFIKIFVGILRSIKFFFLKK